jgi:multidrug resistance efflux pump
MAGRRAALKRLIPILILVATAGATFAYLREQRKPKPIVLAGTLEARTVNVGSLAGGRVVRVLVDEGNAVATGQVLATLETETIDRQIAEQNAAIAVTRAQLAKAVAGPRNEEIRRAAAVAANDERERRRITALYEAGVVARQMLDDATTRATTSAEDLRILREGTRKEDIAAARAQVAQQERHLAILGKQRDESEVKSTVTGTVQSFGLRPGDIVAPNQTVAEVLEPSQLWVRVYVPETLLGLVKVSMPVRVFVDTYPNIAFRGRVATIASEGEYTPRNVQTRAQRAEQVFAVKVITDADPRLKAGMAAQVDLGVEGNAK